MSCPTQRNSSPVNPGIRVQTTKKGLDYANELALNKMYEELSHYQFEDMSDGDFSLFGITISRVSKPSGQVLLIPGQGLKWSLSINGYQLSGHLRYKTKVSKIRVRKTVNIQMHINQIALELIFTPTMATNGGLNLNAAHCTSNVDVKVSSGNLIIKMFNDIFNSKINKTIGKKICDSALKIINNDFATKLANYPVTRSISHGYTFDYGLVSNPVFTSAYMQTNHKAEVFNDNKTDCNGEQDGRHECENSQEATSCQCKAVSGKFPFVPVQLPDINEDEKMIYFIISEYLVNTWLYTAHHDKKLKLQVSPEMFKKEGKRNIFRTKCPGSICIGTFFPKISEEYPDSMIALNFETSNYPSAHFEPNHIQIKVPVTAEFFILRPDETKIKFHTAELVLFSEVNTTIADGSILFTVTNTTITIENQPDDSASSDLFGLKTILEALVKLVEAILPGQQFPLVVPSNTCLSNSNIKIVKNAIIVESDLAITSI
uniref:Lipopolysaccharide binding protein 1 n=1 Tax=Euprymna scolopes TaxID=6613 RepID=G1BIV8_EUPSC|nr:lipopolysaccharide binding protein 1 [Euprymna scolopes]